MLELPSEVTGVQYIRMPKKDKVIDSDNEWNRCGMWILINRSGNMTWIDETWIKLQVLLENGCLIMIKASTAANVPNSNYPGTILCYTKPGRDEIEYVAKEIRKIVHYEASMFYKMNQTTTNKIERRYGYKCISHYMHTFEGFFYRNDRTLHWTLLGENNREQQWKQSSSMKSSMNMGPGDKDYDELPSISNKQFFEVQSKNEKLDKLSTFLIFITCSLEEMENCLTEADRMWILLKKLIHTGVVEKCTCEKNSNTAEFRFVLLDNLDIESIVKFCDEIYNESQVFRFIYFHKNNTKYVYSPEKELYENKKFVFLNAQK